MVFELDSFFESMSDFTGQLESSHMQEKQVVHEDWIQGEKGLAEEVLTSSNWQEQESLPDLVEGSLYWRAQENVSAKTIDELGNSMNARALEELEVYTQSVQLVEEEREDLCEKYLKDELPPLNKSDTACSCQLLPSFIGSYSENLSSSASEEFQPSLRNLPSYTSFIPLHNNEAGCIRNTQSKSESCRYPTETKNWLYPQERDRANQGVYWNREHSQFLNAKHPSYVAACRGTVLEESNANILFDDNCRRSLCLKCSDTQNAWKQTRAGGVSHISIDPPYYLSEEPEKSPDFSDFHGKRSLHDLLEFVGLSIPNSVAEFEPWRQEINAFLKCHGLSRREFAKAARIGKNTVGKYLSGQCKKLSREIVWKILNAYQTLRKELPLLESEQGGTGILKSCKKRRTPKILGKQTTTSQSNDYSCIQTEWDRITRTCAIETESFIMDQTESSGSISFSNLEEQLLSESSGNLPVSSENLCKEAARDELISFHDNCSLQKFHTARACLIEQVHLTDNDMKQLESTKEKSGDNVGFSADEYVWVNHVDEEIHRRYRDSIDTALHQESSSTQNYLSSLLQMQPKVTTTCELQPELAEYNYCPNLEPFIEATTSFHKAPIRIELRLPIIHSDERVNAHTRLSKNGGEEKIGMGDSTANKKYNNLSYICENIIRSAIDYQQICITDDMEMWKEAVELILFFGDESYCGNFVLDFPLSEEFIRLLARQLCTNLNLDFSQVGSILTSITEQLTEYGKYQPETTLVEGAFFKPHQDISNDSNA